MGSERPHKMFLTMEAAHEAMAPAVAAQKSPKWDPLSIQARSPARRVAPLDPSHMRSSEMLMRNLFICCCHFPDFGSSEFATFVHNKSITSCSCGTHVKSRYSLLALQGLRDLKEAPRKQYYSLFSVPGKKAATFDQKYAPPADDADLAGPARKRKSAGNSEVSAKEVTKPAKRQKRQAAQSGNENSGGESEAEEVRYLFFTNSSPLYTNFTFFIDFSTKARF